MIIITTGTYKQRHLPKRTYKFLQEKLSLPNHPAQHERACQSEHLNNGQSEQTNPK